MRDENYFFYLDHDMLTLTSINRENQNYIDIFFEVLDKKEETPNVMEGNIAGAGNTILFFIKRRIYKSMGEYKFQILSYIEYDNEIKLIERLSMQCKELDAFYSIRKAYDFEMFHPTGEVNLRVNSLDSSRDDLSFLINGKSIRATLSISRNVSSSSNSPVTINSTIAFTFEKSNDYSFFMKIVNLIKDFLKIVTYRRNISIEQVILKEKNEEGTYRNVGKLVFPEEQEFERESDKLINQRMIDFSILKQHTADLFQLLASGEIYKDHIPQNSKDKNIITPARFILITAAFEWEFRSSYGNVKAAENSSYKKIQTDIMNHIDVLIKTNSGKKKKYARTFQKIVSNSGMSLSEKILKVLGDAEGILNKYIDYLYSINEIEGVKHSDIAERLQIQRNNYAHGNIDKDLDFLVILDLLVLEWLIYVLVLRKAKMSDAQIDHAINKLFARNFSLEPLKE